MSGESASSVRASLTIISLPGKSPKLVLDFAQVGEGDIELRGERS